MTSIDDAFVNAPDAYEESRAAGGSIPSGLDPKSALPLFADQSYAMYVDFSGFSVLGGMGNLRLQHNYVGDSLNQLNDGFTSPRLKQGDYAVTDAILQHRDGELASPNLRK